MGHAVCRSRIFKKIDGYVVAIARSGNGGCSTYASAGASDKYSGCVGCHDVSGLVLVSGALCFKRPLRLPVQVEHSLGQQDDAYHMAENAYMDVFEVYGSQLALALQRHGCQEMAEYT